MRQIVGCGRSGGVSVTVGLIGRGRGVKDNEIPEFTKAERKAVAKRFKAAVKKDKALSKEAKKARKANKRNKRADEM